MVGSGCFFARTVQDCGVETRSTFINKEVWPCPRQTFSPEGRRKRESHYVEIRKGHDVGVVAAL